MENMKNHRIKPGFIVKFVYTSEDSENTKLFSCDNIEHKFQKISTASIQRYMDDNYQLIGFPEAKANISDSEIDIKVCEITLTAKDKHIDRILAYKPKDGYCKVYVMNEEGQTVDKIDVK